jgi:hypothetical protein
VDYNFSQVEENPSRISNPFNVRRDNAVTLQLFTNFLPDSFNLAGALSTANNKIIGEGANLPRIQHDNIISLFIRSSLNCLPRYFYRLQNSLLQS